MTGELDSMLTLDDPPDEDKRPLHIWTNPLHDSIAEMTPAQQAQLVTPPDEVTLDELYEEAIIGTGVPAKYIQPLLRAIAHPREVEVERGQAAVLHSLVWSAKGANAAALRMALGFVSGESEREFAAIEKFPRSTLQRKIKNLKEKWATAMHKVEA